MNYKFTLDFCSLEKVFRKGWSYSDGHIYACNDAYRNRTGINMYIDLNRYLKYSEIRLQVTADLKQTELEMSFIPDHVRSIVFSIV